MSLFHRWCKEELSPCVVLLLCVMVLCGPILLSGCATRTIYVPHGEPVRLAAPVKDAPVWVQDSDGVWTKGKVTLQEGWYALPDPGEKP